MGNQASSASYLGRPSSELKFRSGVRSEGVPAPMSQHCASYDKLIAHGQFKDYLLSHLDSTHLISSIISSSDKDKIVLEGVTPSLSADLGSAATPRTDIAASLKLLQSLNRAGVSLQVPELVGMCEKELDLYSELGGSITTRALQLRMAALSAVGALMAKERQSPESQWFDMPIARSSVDTSSLPHLHYMLPLQQAGYSLLSMIAKFLPITADEQQRAILLGHLDSFCSSLHDIPSLALFKTWSPATRPPLCALRLNIDSAKASSGDAKRAIDGSGSSFWSCDVGRCDWSVELTEPSNIAAIRISWAPPKSTNSIGSGAPRKMAVLIQKAGQVDRFSLACSVDLESERRKQDSWTHIYNVEASDISAIKIVMTGSAPTSANKKQVHMYSFEVLAIDSTATSLDCMTSLRKLQDALAPLAEEPLAQSHVLNALPVLTRASGSLEMLLSLVKFLRAKNLDEVIRKSAPESMHMLLRSMQQEIAVVEVAAGTEVQGEQVLTNVVFDDVDKSPEAEVSEGGMMIGSSSGGNSYGMLNCTMDSGVWEWEFTLVRENNGDETTCLGVATRPVTNWNYDVTPDMWLVRCYNGELYHSGRQSRRTIPNIHPSDICRFTYDATNLTLSLAVNGTDHGILFENIPHGVAPAVAFYGGGKTVRVLNIRRTGLVSSDKLPSTVKDIGFDDIYGTSFTAAEISSPSSNQSLSEIDYRPSQLLLEKAAAIAQLHCASFYKALNFDTLGAAELTAKKRDLEYPYGIQVHATLFESVIELLDTCDANQPTDVELIGPTLSLIEAQFACLASTRVNPSQLGLGATKEKSCNKVLSILASKLRALTKSDNELIRRLASRAFSAGIPYFFPFIAGRIEFGFSKIRDLLSSSSSSVTTDASKSIVFSAILRRLARQSEIMEMLQLFKTDAVWRAHILEFIYSLLDVAADYTEFSVLGTSPHQDTVGSVLMSSVVLTSDVFTILKRFQEQISYDLITTDIDSSYNYECTLDVMAKYTTRLFDISATLCRQLSTTSKQSLGDISLFNEILTPIIHALAVCVAHTKFVEKILNPTANLLKALTELSIALPECHSAISLLNETVAARNSCLSFHNVSATGWRDVTIPFDESDSSYTILDGGMIYSSTQSSNTCAIVPVRFGNTSRAAWEFLLVQDTNNDECAVFGASMHPITSRCYSSSPNLWMRRAYNGNLYAQGRNLGSPMEKIHPGDIVRVEFDGPAGTLSYSVNSGPLEVAFTGIAEEISPACGSYRSGIRIQLLKVEVLGSSLPGEVRAPGVVNWLVDPTLLQADSNMALLQPSKKLYPEAVTAKDAAKNVSWVTSRGDKGCSSGVHEWAFEVTETSPASLAFGIVSGGEPFARDHLAGCCKPPVPIVSAPSEQGNSQITSRTAVLTTRGLRNYCGRFAGYYDGPSQWCSSRASCSCDGQCGPNNGCMCEECYRVTFPGEFTAPPSPRSGPEPTRDEDAFQRSLIALLPRLSPIVVTDAEAKEESGTVPPLVTDRLIVEPSAPEGGDETLPLLTPPLVRESSAGYLRERGDGSSSVPLENSSSAPPLVAPNKTIDRPKDEVGSSSTMSDFPYSYRALGVVSMAWLSDGSLWFNGEKKADGFGASFLPLGRYAVVSMRVDCRQEKVSYYVNGSFVGTAFGLENSDAIVKVHSLFPPSSAVGSNTTIYPAASVSHCSQGIKIQASGYFGSVVFPSALYMQKTLASVYGRLAAALISGPKLSSSEKLLKPWLKSPLFSGGFAADPDEEATSAKKSFAACVPSGFFRVSVKWFDGVLERSSLILSESKLKLKFDLIEGDDVVSSSSTTIALPGVDVDWSVFDMFELLWDRSSVSLPVSISTKVMIERQDDSSEIIGAAVVDVTNELWADRSQGSYFVPVHPKGIMTLSVAFVERHDSLSPKANVTEQVPSLPEVFPAKAKSILNEIATVNNDTSNLVVEWLERIEPEPAFLKKAFEASGRYSFPKCERPLIACLIMHGGMVSEIEGVLNLLKSAETGIPAPAPSSNMVSLWKRVKQFRQMLRHKKESLKIMPSSSASTNDISTALERPVASSALALDSAASPGSTSAARRDFFLSQGSIQWRLQSHDTISSFSTAPRSYHCTVTSFGIDLENEVAYISFNVRGDMSLGDLQHPNVSKLFVDDIEVGSPACLLDVDDCRSNYVGFLRFGLSTFEVVEVKGWKFQFGKSGYSQIDLVPPTFRIGGEYKPPSFDALAVSLSSVESGTQNQKKSKTFDEYLDELLFKINFLRKLSPASESSNTTETSKMLLIDLMDKYSDGNGIAPKLVRWRTEEGQSKWKNMVEFLRVHTKLRRQVSFERGLKAGVESSLSSGDPEPDLIHSVDELPPIGDMQLGPQTQASTSSMLEDDVGYLQDMSPIDAAMQACTVFITHEFTLEESKGEGNSKINSSSEIIETGMKDRILRAKLRCVGLKALSDILNMPSISSDPYVVSDLVLFLRSSFVGDVEASKGANRRVHYLNNLEGCSPKVLADVQGAFLDTYSTSFQIIHNYLSKWRLRPGTDESFPKSMLLTDCGESDSTREMLNSVYLYPIRLLLSSWGLHFSGRDHRFLLHSNIIAFLQKVFSLSELERVTKDWIDAANKYMSFIGKYERKFTSTNSDSGDVKYQLLNSEIVQEGLATGALSCRQVLLHIYRLPLALFSETDINELQLDRACFKSRCEKMNISDVSFYFEKVRSVVIGRETLKKDLEDKKKEKDKASRSAAEAKLHGRLCSGGVPLFDKSAKSKECTIGASGMVVTSELCEAPRTFHVRCAFADLKYSFRRGDEKTGNYFEVTILELGEQDIGVGLAVKGEFYVTGNMPGWVEKSYGYHGDDGRKFGSNSTPGTWPKWNKFDVIGCGIDFATRNIFYTRNGELLGDAFIGVAEETLSPIVGFHCPRMVQKVRINFGQYPFSYRGEEIKAHPKAIAISEYFMNWQSKNPASEASPAFGQVVAAPAPPATIASISISSPTVALPVEEEKNEDEVYETKEDLSIHCERFTPRNDVEYKQHLNLLEERVNLASDHLLNFNIMRKQTESLMKLFLVSSCIADNSSEAPMSETHSDLPDLLKSPPSLTKGKSIYGTPKFVTAEDGALLQESVTAVLIQDILVGSIYLREAAKAIPGGVRNVAATSIPLGLSIAEITSKLDEFVRGNAEFGHNSSQAGLEVCEVEGLVFDRLNTILSFSSAVSSVAKDLSRSICLKAFVTLLCVGTPRIRSLTCRVLMKCLPVIEPYVVDAVLPDTLWPVANTNAVEDEAELLGPCTESPGRNPNRSGSKRRGQRSMPNLFIRGLIKIIQVSVTSSNAEAVPASPVGYGTLLVEHADEIISLLQRLFETDSWTEVIAFTLTDVLRETVTYMKRQNGLNSGLAELQSNEIDSLLPEQFESASAVCVALSGLGALFPGATVQKADGGQFTLISLQSTEGTAIVVNKEQLTSSGPDTYLSGLNLTETVKTKDISSVAFGSNVVLSELSHPLVQLLSAVLKQGLVWFRSVFGTHMNSAELFSKRTRSVCAKSSEGMRSLFRLTSLAANAFNVLLNKQQISFVDLMDADSIEQDVVSLALLPTGISVSPRIADVESAEKFLQARAIEGVLRTADSKLVQAGDSGSSVEPEGTGSLGVGGGEPSSLPLVNVCEFVPIEPKVQLSFDEKIEKARELKSEFGLSSEAFCVSLIDYFAYDEVAVRSYMTANLKLVVLMDHEFSDPIEYEYWNKHISGPEMILKQVDTKSYELTSGTKFAGDDVEVDLPMLQRCQLQVALIQAPKGSTPSNDLEHLSTGELVAVGDAEGHALIQEQRLYVCGSDYSESTKSDIIVRSCDVDLGVSISSSAKQHALRKVVKIFDTDVSRLHEFQVQIDIALIILRMRLISSKLLLEGNINFMRGRQSLQNWMNLMKLNNCCGSIPSNGDFGQFTLSNLATSYINTSRMFESIKVQESSDGSNSIVTSDSGSGSTMEDDVIDCLISDVSKNFTVLLDTSNMADPSVQREGNTSKPESAESDSMQKYNNFQSVHPLILGHSVAGEFRFPPDWKGAVIAMDSRSAIPESIGAMKIFSKSDYPFGKPASTRTTMKVGTISRVPSVVITEKKSFVFKFDSKEPTEKRKCTMKCVYGGLKEISSSDEFGVQYLACGNELSLSSAADLTDRGEGASVSTIVPRGNYAAPSSIFPVQSTLCAANSAEMENGLWFFEVQVGTTTVSSKDSAAAISTCDDPTISVASVGVSDAESKVTPAVAECSAAAKAGFDMIGIVQFGSMMEHVSLSRSSSLVPSISHIKSGCFVCSDRKVRVISASAEEARGFSLIELDANELGEWDQGDTIGCLLHCDNASPRITFSRNGVWLKDSIDISAISPAAFFPAVCVRNGTSFKPCLDSRSESPDAATYAALLNSSDVQPIRYPDSAWSDRMNWGYRFSLRRLYNLYIRVARDFELVWRSDTADTPKGDKRILIWKPINLRVDFGACCQVVTTSASPPIGAIIVSRNQCKPPVSFTQVFSSTTLKMTVWRPKPPDENYVALGDVVVSGNSQSSPSTESVLCVPVWAVQACNVGNRLFKSDKGGDKSGQKLSVWSVENHLGSFVGVPSHNWSNTTDTFKLNSDVYNIINGEWFNESDALLQPSLSWTCSMMNFLLSNDRCCKKAVQSSIFATLTSYVQVNTALSRLKVIPILIRIIRLSCIHNILLPIESLDAACKLILTHASTKIQKEKDELSDELMTLLDLVVEVAAAKIHGLRSIATAMSETAPSIGALQLGSGTSGGESKDETEYMVESKEDAEVLCGSVKKTSLSKFILTESVFSSSATTSSLLDPFSQSQWWNVNISTEEKKMHRLTPEVIDMEKMQMRKMSSMYRLRQVISFLDSLVPNNSLSDRIYSLPFGMLMRAWYEHISLCAFEESSHPVQTSGPPIKKRIYFPCATSITVTFDSRCHLSRGQLSLTCGEASKTKTYTYKMDTWPKAPLQIVGDYVDIEFVANVKPDDESVDTSSGADWGWALVALASGALYEATLTEIAVPELLETPVLNTASEDSATATSGTINSPVDGETSAVSQLLAPCSVNAAPLPVNLENKEHNRTVLVTTLGSKIASGEIRSPHASQFDVIIDRPNAKKTGRNIVHVLVLRHKKNGVIQSEYVQVDGRQKHKFSIQGDSATYEIFALHEDLIPNFDVSVLDAATTAAASAQQPDLEQSSVPVSVTRLDIATAESEAIDTNSRADTSAIVNTSPIGATAVASAGDTMTSAAISDHFLGFGEPRSDRWGCQICTFLNELSDDSCSMCGMPRGDAHGEDGEAEPRDVGTPVPTAAAWWCARCTFMNPLANTGCDMCGAPRPGEEASGVAALDAALAEALRSNGVDLDHADDDEDDDENDDEDEDEDENHDEDEDQDEEEDEEEEEESEQMHEEWREGAEDLPVEWAEPRPDPPAATAVPAPPADVEDEEEEEEDAGLVSLFDEVAAASSRLVPSLAREPSEGFAELLLSRTASDSGTVAATGTAMKNKELKDLILITTVVTKIRSTAKMEVRLEQVIASKRWAPVEFMHRMHSHWSKEQDHALLDFLDSMESNSSMTIKTLMAKIPTITLPKKFMEYKKSGFSDFNMLEVQSRLLLICYFNQHIEELLPIINIRNMDPLSLGAKIRRSNKYIFMRLKQPLLDKAIEATAAPSGSGLPASLSLDNMKALASRDLGEIEPTNSNCIFVQAFKELNSKDPMIFRHVTSNDRVFAVDFKEERGIDAGGVFREGVTRIVEDVFSEHFNLLILCPNGVHQVHLNMDKFVPNPRHTSSLALQMFEFLGKMMGMSLRVKLYLPFEFPPIVWKLLVGETPTFDDLMAIDSITCKFLDAVRNCELDDIVDQDLFALKYGDKLRFVYTGSDGVERELMKGGKSVSVTFHNRVDYCNMVIEARLSEFNKQVAAMSRGLGEVVPLRVLQLFSWAQLEVLVSGSPVFDIALWKRNTEASGVSKETLALFWKVIESMTPKEQAGFVRFAWGRSRLPSAEDFTTKMKLTNAGSASLPLAHTCFFSVEMPAYTTETAMRHGLMTAIHFGAGGILMS